MRTRSSLSIGLSLLLGAALLPSPSRSEKFENTVAGHSDEMARKIDAATVESMRRVLLRPTVKEVGIQQVAAIKTLTDLYAKPTTSEALKNRIVTVLLVDTVDSHPWNTRIAVKAIEAMETLHAGAGDELKKTIVARLTRIHTTYEKHLGMYDKDRARAAGGVLNRLSSKKS